MKFNPFSKKSKLEEKSIRNLLQASVIIDNQGNVIDTVFSSDEDAIRKNSSIHTILSKQSSIISEATLTIKEKNKDQDQETTNQDALQFLKWLEFPNTYPSPTNGDEIIQYILSENFKNGLSGVIFNFDSEIGINNWKNIQLAQKVDLENTYNKVSYRVEIDQKTSMWFTQDVRYPGLFVNENGDNVSVLFVSGYYNIKKQCYESPFENIIQYIHLQNHLINFSSSFYKNACFPSQIVQLTYKDINPEKPLSETQVSDFLDAVKQVEAQLNQSKSAKNAGKIIVPKHPSLNIDVKPLSIPTGVADTTSYDEWVSTKIFSSVDGGSKSSFEGENEYSNNAIVKLEDLYDGTFRIFQSAVVTKLNNFMISLFTIMKVKVNLQETYLSVDISKIKLYQKQGKAEVRELVKESIITINEGRDKLGEITETYADLEDIEQGDKLTIEFGKKSPDAPADNDDS